MELKNQTVKSGDNVTFICATSSTPMASIFWFYLNTTIFESNVEFDDFVQITNEQKSLKYEIEKVRIKEPNENHHSVNLADRDIEKLKIYNVDENDIRKYLCIVSNGYSYRVSLAYLTSTNNVVSQIKIDPIKKLSYISISIIIVASISIAAIILISIFICLHLKYQKSFYKCCLNVNKKDKIFLNGPNVFGSRDKNNNAHGSLQKGFEAMKNNFLYPYMPNGGGDAIINSNESSKRSCYINDILHSNSNNSTNSEKQLLNSIDSNSFYDVEYINMIQQLIDDKDYLIPFEK